mmetsp:Transcript_98506/g.234530  ORF Transcript_98506/g.234530 Transcript_98506/m.234530 type:complete len:234 (-) Transcript_98506:2-703(-)
MSFNGPQPPPLATSTRLSARAPLHPRRQLTVRTLSCSRATVLGLQKSSVTFRAPSSGQHRNPSSSLPLICDICVAGRPCAPRAKFTVLRTIAAGGGTVTEIRIMQRSLACGAATAILLTDNACPGTNTCASNRWRPFRPVRKHTRSRLCSVRAVGVCRRAVCLIVACVLLHLLARTNLCALVEPIAVGRATNQPVVQIFMGHRCHCHCSKSCQSSGSFWPRHDGDLFGFLHRP